MSAPPAIRRIIWCSAHHWESAVQVSAHQLVRELATRGHDVLFLSTPVTPYHLAAVRRSADHRARFRAWHRRGRRSGGVLGYTPLTVLPLSMVLGLRYQSVLRHWQDFTVPRLGPALRRLGFAAPDLTVVDTPLYAYLLGEVNARRSVYRVTDFNPGFASGTDELRAIEKEAVGAADVTVYTAPALRPYASHLGARDPRFVGHGVDVDRFSAPAPVPPEYASIPSPRAVYVGSLREWLDYDLINAAAEALGHVSFVVVGPEHWARSRFRDLPNLHVIGERPHGSIPGFLQHADVGIIPFDRAGARELVDAINPLKLYEYAAAGLPIVATETPTIVGLESPALLASAPAQFVERIEAALRGHDAIAASCRVWSAQHTWAHRADQLMDAVGFR